MMRSWKSGSGLLRRHSEESRKLGQLILHDRIIRLLSKRRILQRIYLLISNFKSDLLEPLVERKKIPLNQGFIATVVTSDEEPTVPRAPLERFARPTRSRMSLFPRVAQCESKSSS